MAPLFSLTFIAYGAKVDPAKTDSIRSCSVRFFVPAPILVISSKLLVLIYLPPTHNSELLMMLYLCSDHHFQRPQLPQILTINHSLKQKKYPVFATEYP